jgi:hypothetical protein
MLIECTLKIHDTYGENNNNYGNRKLSKIYKENPELAKEKQSRPGIKNGRCIKVAMFTIDKSFYKEFNYVTRMCRLHFSFWNNRF